MTLDSKAAAPPGPAADGPDDERRVVGRYQLFREIAAGGMASVHIARLLGPVGFSRTVAIKRLHKQFARDPEFVAMFLDEARIAARIRHPNVVQTLDVVAAEGELFLVMDYIEGESLARLLRASARLSHPVVPPRIVLSILSGMLQGLHAAHEARGENGQLLGVVHRDVSPQNVLVGADGTARVLDFGIAKAMGRLQSTRSGQLKGKPSYMAPEQIRDGAATARSDIYSASIVLWEALTGSRLFVGEDGAMLGAILDGKVPPPSAVEPSVSPMLDAIVLRGASLDPSARFSSAMEMARALTRVMDMAPPVEVAEWVAATAGSSLAQRAAIVSALESSSGGHGKAPSDARDAFAQLTPGESASGEALPATAVKTAAAAPRSTQPKARPRFALAALALLAVAILAGVTSLLWARRTRAPEPWSAASASSTAMAAATASAMPAEPAPDAEPARPVATSSAVPSASPDPTPPGKRSPGQPPVSNCNPPYYYDRQGFKVYKPGCLR
ncbi:MAG: serine/threonine protein kinase [Deltaproteobacteria bacterium]|nr:serine/threonine protein kinase [Deltaproteobacteria bacterium]